MEPTAPKPTTLIDAFREVVTALDPLEPMARKRVLLVVMALTVATDADVEATLRFLSTRGDRGE